MHLRECLNSALVMRVLYENSTDVKVALFFTAEVLSEEPILKWYKDAHVAKGKSVFLEQMKKFVEWLKNAEEGKSFHLCSLFGKAW